MRLLITHIILLFATNVWGQTDLGIGLVSIKFDNRTILHFFKNTTDNEPIKTIEFFTDTTINSWNIRNLEKQEEWLKPESLWLDYSSFVFRCKTQTNEWYELIVNNENGQTFWLKKGELTEFLSWENYLNGMFEIARLSDQKQKIRTLPNDNSEEIKYSGQDCFQIKSMKGDWIEIFTADYCDDGYTDSKTKIKSGWIKWRCGNQLLSEYFLTS